MSRKDKFFQFPLSCLAYGNNVLERGNDLIGWCVVDAGLKGLERLEADGQDNMIDAIIDNCRLELDADNLQHRALVIGLETLGVTARSVSVIIEQHERVSAFIQQMESLHGTSPFVRIKTGFVWQAVNKAREPSSNGMSWRELSVLCAVYAILGNKGYMRICRDRIIAASLGYKSAKVMCSHMPYRKDKAEPLTVNQLRATLDLLEAEGLFCRIHSSPRKTYFSNRMERDKLEEVVLKKETSRAIRLNQNRANDRKLQAKIRQMKQPHNPSLPPP